MRKLRIALINCCALLLTAALFSGPALATGIRIVPSNPWVIPGSDFSFDVVAEGIPADGLGGVQFRLNVTAPAGNVIGLADLSQGGADNVVVASSLLISPPTATRSGIGDFFWNGRGDNGILVMDNEALTNGSALFTYAHTNGATPPAGSGSVARFMVRVGSGITADHIDINLSDVMLLDGGPVYPLDYNTGATISIKCMAKVPALLGLTLAQAQAALLAANLTLGSVFEIDNSNGVLPLNVVLQQSTTAGSSTFCQTPVNLAMNTPPVVALNQVVSPTTLGNQTLSGTMDSGTTVSLSVNTSATIGPVTYPTSTSWSCPIASLTAGINTLTITALDIYGNRNSIGAVIDYQAPNQAPSITSANNTSFSVGTPGSFTVTSTGYPLPALSHTGSLPTGVTFNDSTGVLSGSPSAGTGGTYILSIIASNGVTPSSIQTFVLTVNQAPAITSANNTSFSIGTSGSFTVTTTGYPIPTLSHTGSLPAGVTFNDSTGELSGKPSVGPGTVGTYILTITAHNNIGPNAVQGFTLTVNPDTTSPVLILSSISDGGSTNNDVLNIYGTVSDGSGIISLIINGVSVTINPDAGFSYPLPLHGGANIITTVATDAAGNQTTDTRNVTLDMTLPALSVTAPDDNSTSNKQFVTVTGTIDQASTLQISVNGGTPLNAAVTGSAFGQAVTLATGMNTLEITATDLSGKKNSTKRTIIYDSQHPTINITAPGQDILTTQPSMNITGTVADALEPLVVTVTSGADIFTPGVAAGAFEQAVPFTEVRTYPIIVKITETGGNETTLQRNIIHVMPDSVKPVITPTKTASQTVSGTMESGTTVTVSCPPAVVGAVAYPTGSTWTADLTGLREGANVLTVTFTDMSGTVTTAQSTIFLDSVPPADGALHATAGNTQINLDWSLFSDTGSGIDSYKLVYDTLALPVDCLSGTTIFTGANTSYLHSGLINGATYYYRVCAIDKAANVSAGATASVAPKLQYPLTVTKTGTGTGTVSGGAINCGSTCSAVLDPGSKVTLLAVSDAGSAFVGWNGGGCAGVGSCVVTMNQATTLTAQFALQPGVSAVVAGKGWQSSGVLYLDLQITNSGGGDARNLKLNSLVFRTLTGSGTVTYNTSLSQALPYTVGDLNAGVSVAIRVYLNVPTTVKRFSITESGTVQDVIGTNSTYSILQAVFP